MTILNDFRLDGRRALVTGASTGLGLEIARALHQAGANLLLSSRSAERLAAAAEQLRNPDAPPVHTLVADLATPAGANALCDQVLADHAPVDILVNNVGGRRINFPTEELPLDEWQRILDLNLTHAFLCTKRLGGAMLSRGWGRVIHVSSISAQWAGKHMRGRSYETAKAALTMFTKAVAADWAARGVTVNALAPGPFLTDANRRWFADRPELRAQFEAEIPMGRLGDPREIAGAALFLASPAASYVTGTVLVVDGGRLLW